MESIRYLRHHPKSGVLHYRRVVPAELRPILGKETISATLGSKTLDHDALQRWIEIDRDALQRLDDARHQLAHRQLPQDGRSTTPVFIDIRKCLVSFATWKEREIGRESVLLYGRPEDLIDDRAWERLEEGRRDLREKLTHPEGYKAIPGFDEKLREALGNIVQHIPADHVVMNVLRPTFRDAWVEVFALIDGLISAIRGTTLVAADPTEPIRSGLPPALTPSSAGSPTPGQTNLRLSELAKAYVAECGADPDYGVDLKTYARRLGESLGGDIPVRQITKRDLMTFKDRIAKVPARPTHSQRKLPLLELIAVTEHQQLGGIAPSRRCLSAKTVKKWLDYLGAMFRYGVANEHCMVNPAAGIVSGAAPARRFLVDARTWQGQSALRCSRLTRCFW